MQRHDKAGPQREILSWGAKTDIGLLRQKQGQKLGEDQKENSSKQPSSQNGIFLGGRGKQKFGKGMISKKKVFKEWRVDFTP